MSSLRLVAAEKAWQLYDNKVDSLSFFERISLHTNTIDWIALVPNLGIEFTLGNTNWHKWTVGLNGRWKPSTTKGGITQYAGWTITDARAELRKYWHGRGVKRVFYWGLYGGAAKFDVKWGSDGRKGNAFYGGLTAGTVTPLYAYPNGSNLDFELALSLGVGYGKYDKYEVSQSGESYQFTTTSTMTKRELLKNPLLLAGLADVVRVGFVYHFGTPVCDRYKKRVIVDEQYMRDLDAKRFYEDSVSTEKKKIAEERRDSLFEIDYMKRLEKQRAKIEERYRKMEEKSAAAQKSVDSEARKEDNKEDNNTEARKEDKE